MTLNPRLIERVKPELQTGETLLWVAAPDAKRQVLLGVLISVFAIPWILHQGFFQGNQPSPTWGAFGPMWLVFKVLDLLFSIVLLLCPLLIYGYVKSTLYAITNWRVLIIHEDWSKRVRAYNGNSVKYIARHEQPDGSGDLVFMFKHQFVEISESGVIDRRVKFFGIPKIRAVEDLLLKTFPGRA